MDEVIAGQQVDTVVIPRLLLSQTLLRTHIHIGADHQKAFPVMLATDIGIARSPFDTGVLGIAEDRVAIEQVVIVEAVATEGVGRPSPTLLVHVTIEVAIAAFLQVAFLGQERLRERYQQSRQEC